MNNSLYCNILKRSSARRSGVVTPAEVMELKVESLKTNP